MENKRHLIDNGKVQAKLIYFIQRYVGAVDIEKT